MPVTFWELIEQITVHISHSTEKLQ